MEAEGLTIPCSKAQNLSELNELSVSSRQSRPNGGRDPVVTHIHREVDQRHVCEQHELRKDASVSAIMRLQKAMQSAGHKVQYGVSVL